MEDIPQHTHPQEHQPTESGFLRYQMELVDMVRDMAPAAIADNVVSAITRVPYTFGIPLGAALCKAVHEALWGPESAGTKARHGKGDAVAEFSEEDKQALYREIAEDIQRHFQPHEYFIRHAASRPLPERARHIIRMWGQKEEGCNFIRLIDALEEAYPAVARITARVRATGLPPKETVEWQNLRGAEKEEARQVLDLVAMAQKMESEILAMRT